MPIRNKERYTDPELQRFVRKRDQAWDLAGLARQDGDTNAEQRHTTEARTYAAEIRERTLAGAE